MLFSCINTSLQEVTSLSQLNTGFRKRVLQPAIFWMCMLTKWLFMMTHNELASEYKTTNNFIFPRLTSKLFALSSSLFYSILLCVYWLCLHLLQNWLNGVISYSVTRNSHLKQICVIWCKILPPPPTTPIITTRTQIPSFCWHFTPRHQAWQPPSQQQLCA